MTSKKDGILKTKHALTKYLLLPFFLFFFSPPLLFDPLKKNSEDYYLLLKNRFVDIPTEEGLNPRMNLRDGASRGSSLMVFFLEEGPPGAPMLLIDPDDLESNIDEPKEASAMPNDKGTLFVVSCG